MRQPPVELDATGEELYEINAILNSRRSRTRGFQYLVKYTGYYETTWQPLSDLVAGNSGVLINDFHAQNPRKPRPTDQEFDVARAIAREGTEHSTPV